jgi:hypothetical protein
MPLTHTGWMEVYLLRDRQRHLCGFVRGVQMAGIEWWEAADVHRRLLRSSYGAVRKWMLRREAEEAVRLHRPDREVRDG